MRPERRALAFTFGVVNDWGEQLDALVVVGHSNESE